MGEAKRKRERHAAILRANPFCVFCGGDRASKTIDHQPPKIFFRSKRFPDGYEFAACEACNLDFGSLEQVAALWFNLSDHGAKHNPDDLHKKISGVYNNERDALPIPVKERAVWRRSARELGVEIPLGSAFSDFPIVKIPLKAKLALLVSGAKIAVALYHKHVGLIFPKAGKADVRFDANIVFDWPERASRLVDLTPNMSTPAFQNEDLSDQFSYRWSYTPEVGAFLLLIKLGSAFVLHCALINDRGQSKLPASDTLPIWQEPKRFRENCQQRLEAEDASGV